MKKIKTVKLENQDKLNETIFKVVQKQPDIEWSIFDSKNKIGCVELWIKNKDCL